MQRSLLALCLTVAFTNSGVSVAAGAIQPDNNERLQSYLAAAQQAAARKDFSSAAVSYRQAVQISPQTAELWTNLGLMYHETSNFPEAIKSFTEAARLKPTLYVPQLFMGIDNLELKQIEAAIPFLQKAEKLNPKDAQAPITLGRAYAIAGNGNGASDAYWRAVTLAPQNGNAWLGLGMAYLEQVDSDARVMTSTYKDSNYDLLRASELFADQGKLVQAARAYKTALSSASPAPCSHAGYGIVLLRQKSIAEAETEFDREVTSNPGCPLTRIGVAALKLVQGDTASALNKLFALWNADAGFLRENLPLLRDGITSEQSQKLFDLAKEGQAENKVPAGFVDSIQASLESDVPVAAISPESENEVPESEKAASPLPLQDAEKLFLSGQFRKCSDSLRPRLSTLTERSLSLLSSCAFYTGDYRTAAQAARRLAANAMARPVGLYWESKADQKLAVAALVRAGEIDADSPRMHVLLGDTYRQRRKWGDAESEYRKALELEPGNRSGRMGLAIALFQDGNNEDSLKADNVLLQKDPDDPHANLLAAEILVALHEFADAETYLNRCSKIEPEFMARVHALFGEVYANTNRPTEALAELKLGSSGDKNGSLHYQLARLYQKAGNTKAAAEAFQTSKKLRAQWDASAVDAVQQSGTDISRK
jgi:tetratricopeptide (TPR) repeat protein